MNLKEIESLIQDFTDTLYNIADYLADSKNRSNYSALANGIKLMMKLKDYVANAASTTNPGDTNNITKCSNEWLKISFKLNQLIADISRLGADTTNLDLAYTNISNVLSTKRCDAAA